MTDRPNPPAPFPAREGGAGNLIYFTGEERTENLTPIPLQGRGWGRGYTAQKERKKRKSYSPPLAGEGLGDGLHSTKE